MKTSGTSPFMLIEVALNAKKVATDQPVTLDTSLSNAVVISFPSLSTSHEILHRKMVAYFKIEDLF